MAKQQRSQHRKSQATSKGGRKKLNHASKKSKAAGKNAAAQGGYEGAEDEASLHERLAQKFMAAIPDEVTVREWMSKLPSAAALMEDRSHLRSTAESNFAQCARIYGLCGCSCILAYGVGSKKAFLERMVPETIPGVVAAVDGYKRNVRAREVYKAAWEVLNTGERASEEGEEDEDESALHEGIRRNASERNWVTVIVHGCDGPSLRNWKAQEALADLVQLPGVGLVMSVDGVNSQLLWSPRLANRMGMVYVHTPTFEFEKEETAGLPLVYAGKEEEGQARQAAAVLSGLTQGAKKVFKILAEEQASQGSSFGGLAMGDWFERCRQRFLVSSEMTLRAHVNEFLDHELISIRRSTMAGERAFVSLSHKALAGLLSEPCLAGSCS